VLVGIDASRAVIAQRTGTEVYSLHLIRGLLEGGRAHRFRLYFSQPPPQGLIPVVDHCERRVIPFPRLWTHLRLSAEMLARPPDVLFVPSHVLPLVHPRRSVVTVHDLGYHYYPEAHTADQRCYLEWSTRYHVRTAAHIVADSQATKDDLVRLYGAAPNRVTVAHLGVDPSLQPVYDPVLLARVRLKYGISAPYLLYVGTLQPRKNLARLIEAFGEVGMWGNGQGLGLQLVLAGKRGWLCEEILSRVRELGLSGQVVFPGYVDGADLAALYSGASLFVMPSLYEGFCMPALEAMACGTPVVCSNVSSLPEVVGDAAWLFDPRDVAAMALAMKGVLEDGDRRQAMVARGFEQVRRFTWTRCAQQVLGVLERVTGQGGETGVRSGC
jgi:glycosyltransferase involved in cell wall biosynthesis